MAGRDEASVCILKQGKQGHRRGEERVECRASSGGGEGGVVRVGMKDREQMETETLQLGKRVSSARMQGRKLEGCCDPIRQGGFGFKHCAVLWGERESNEGVKR